MNWDLAGVIDVDGNGAMDFVWVQPDGTLVAWLINPTNVPSPTIVTDAGKAPAGLVPVEP